MNLTQKIEAYLFYTGEPIAIKKLAKVFDVTEGEVNDAIKMLEENISGHGIILMKNGDEVMLATHPEMGDVILSIKKQELSDPLSKSALETLTIILYKDGATKPEIDFIRGVNSGFMLRNLLVRGLIEKIPNPDDNRVTKYKATFDTMRYLGISDISELPNFEHFKSEIEKREETEPVAETNVFTE
jgi:segregation and condensation protein B